MKKIFLLFIFIFSLQLMYAQKRELIQLTATEYPYFVKKTEYKYPAYTRGKLSFKNGDVASARINYNNFLNVVRYIDTNRDTLEIANADDIEYIATGTDTIFYDNGYYEWVASSPTARLAVRKTYKIAYRALVGAFGTSSPAKHVQTSGKVAIYGIASQQLSSNEVITLSKETMYYISPINAKINFVAATKKNIDKLFPKKNIEDFIKENSLNLNKEEDLIDLMVYISKPKK